MLYVIYCCMTDFNILSLVGHFVSGTPAENSHRSGRRRKHLKPRELVSLEVRAMMTHYVLAREDDNQIVDGMSVISGVNKCNTQIPKKTFKLSLYIGSIAKQFDSSF